jgi:hypothetical protein
VFGNILTGLAYGVEYATHVHRVPMNDGGDYKFESGRPDREFS